MKIATLINLSPVLGLFLASLTITSCQEDEAVTREEVSSYEAQENLERTFSTINSIAIAALSYAENELSGRIAQSNEFSCASVTFEGTADMGKINIDYGDGCKGPDGRTRKGQITVEYSGKRIFYGSVVYAVLTDFYMDNCKIEGTLKSENISSNSEKPVYNITVTSGKYTKPDQTTYTSWKANRTHTWSYSGDSYRVSITGTSSGRISGNEYSTEIIEPLIVESQCVASGVYVPVQGKKKITLQSGQEIVVDYGSGECDKEVAIN